MGKETFVLKNINERHVEKSNIAANTQRFTRYYLGEKFQGIYLTLQEGRCAFYLMHGNNVKITGQALKLSPATVNYYTNNMCRKLRCSNRKELFEKIRISDFAKYISELL